MTEREVYKYVLMELNKVKAPSLHLEEYNYFANKGVQEYLNERYIQYQTSQQLTDDLQALRSSVDGTISGASLTYTGSAGNTAPYSLGKRYGSDYGRFLAPENYWHCLGIHVTTSTNFAYKCYAAGFENSLPSKKLTADIAIGISNNEFLKPSFERIYHEFVDSLGGDKLPDIIMYFGDATRFSLNQISIEYLKQPQKINLTLAQRDSITDTSNTLEYPEYVCNEIIKRIVKLCLENSSDPRLQTHIPVNKTVQ